MKAVVVGAGIMGHLLALALVRDGHQVTVFDVDENSNFSNCSRVAAGLLAPVSELEKSPWLIYELGREALSQHWPAILSTLNAEFYFERNGILVLSHPQDKKYLMRFIHMIESKFESKADSPYYQKLNKNGIVALEPQLSKFEEAYYFPGEAHLDTQVLLSLLKHYLSKCGVIMKQGWVDEMVPGVIKVNNRAMAFDGVFDCRGMGAKSIFGDLQGIRGELIWLYAPNVDIKRPIRFLHPRYSLYIVPRSNHIYLIGSSEIHCEDYDPISVRTTLELLTAAYYINPGFSEARVCKTVTQVRPTLPHYLPKIKYADGFVAVNGLYRHGFLIAPTLSEEIMRWLKEGKSALHYPQIGEFL